MKKKAIDIKVKNVVGIMPKVVVYPKEAVRDDKHKKGQIRAVSQTDKAGPDNAT
jgi:hypothetical protein